MTTDYEGHRSTMDLTERQLLNAVDRMDHTGANSARRAEQLPDIRAFLYLAARTFRTALITVHTHLHSSGDLPQELPDAPLGASDDSRTYKLDGKSIEVLTAMVDKLSATYDGLLHTVIAMDADHGDYPTCEQVTQLVEAAYGLVSIAQRGVLRTLGYTTRPKLSDTEIHGQVAGLVRAFRHPRLDAEDWERINDRLHRGDPAKAFADLVTTIANGRVNVTKLEHDTLHSLLWKLDDSLRPSVIDAVPIAAQVSLP